jgi:predicted SAM-dependent methyltransferase
MGIDPYLPESAQQQKPFPILKGDLQSLQHMTFDLITLHHVFEHLPDPIETLKAIEKLLNPQGIILIRVPIADSWAYEHYKENWFALDPPRHVFIHTRKGMSLLCDKAGLEVFEMRHDSNCFQFLFSNFYQRNLPMYGSHSPLSNKFQIILKTPQMIYWNLKAQKLNREQRGDQICFYLRKKTNPAHCLDSTR